MHSSRDELRRGVNAAPVIASVFAELARRTRAFSALSARKKNSRGDSSLRRTGSSTGLHSSESVREGESRALTPGESPLGRPKKLGTGSAEGAGDAWNVEPAKMGAEASWG